MEYCVHGYVYKMASPLIGLKVVADTPEIAIDKFIREWSDEKPLTVVMVYDVEDDTVDSKPLLSKHL